MLQRKILGTFYKHPELCRRGISRDSKHSDRTPLRTPNGVLKTLSFMFMIMIQRLRTQYQAAAVEEKSEHKIEVNNYDSDPQDGGYRKTQTSLGNVILRALCERKYQWTRKDRYLLSISRPLKLLFQSSMISRRTFQAYWIHLANGLWNWLLSSTHESAQSSISRFWFFSLF